MAMNRIISIYAANCTLKKYILENKTEIFLEEEDGH